MKLHKFQQPIKNSFQKCNRKSKFQLKNPQNIHQSIENVNNLENFIDFVNKYPQLLESIRKHKSSKMITNKKIIDDFEVLFNNNQQQLGYNQQLKIQFQELINKSKKKQVIQKNQFNQQNNQISVQIKQSRQNAFKSLISNMNRQNFRNKSIEQQNLEISLKQNDKKIIQSEKQIQDVNPQQKSRQENCQKSQQLQKVFKQLINLKKSIIQLQQQIDEQQKKNQELLEELKSESIKMPKKKQKSPYNQQKIDLHNFIKYKREKLLNKNYNQLLLSMQKQITINQNLQTLQKKQKQLMNQGQHSRSTQEYRPTQQNIVQEKEQNKISILNPTDNILIKDVQDNQIKDSEQNSNLKNYDKKNQLIQKLNQIYQIYGQKQNKDNNNQISNNHNKHDGKNQLIQKLSQINQIYECKQHVDDNNQIQDNQENEILIDDQNLYSNQNNENCDDSSINDNDCYDNSYIINDVPQTDIHIENQGIIQSENQDIDIWQQQIQDNCKINNSEQYRQSNYLEKEVQDNEQSDQDFEAYKDTSDYQENLMILENIAIQIQKVWRGYHTRKVLREYFELWMGQQLQEEYQKQQYIQSRYMGDYENYQGQNGIIWEDENEDLSESISISRNTFRGISQTDQKSKQNEESFENYRQNDSKNSISNSQIEINVLNQSQPLLKLQKTRSHNIDIDEIQEENQQIQQISGVTTQFSVYNEDNLIESLKRRRSQSALQQITLQSKENSNKTRQTIDTQINVKDYKNEQQLKAWQEVVKWIESIFSMESQCSVEIFMSKVLEILGNIIDIANISIESLQYLKINHQNKIKQEQSLQDSSSDDQLIHQCGKQLQEISKCISRDSCINKEFTTYSQSWTTQHNKSKKSPINVTDSSIQNFNNTIFLSNPFQEFNAKLLKDLSKRENLEIFIQMREKALKNRVNEELKGISNQLQQNQISPKAFKKKQYELEKWVEKQQDHLKKVQIQVYDIVQDEQLTKRNQLIVQRLFGIQNNSIDFTTPVKQNSFESQSLQKDRSNQSLISKIQIFDSQSKFEQLEFDSSVTKTVFKEYSNDSNNTQKKLQASSKFKSSPTMPTIPKVITTDDVVNESDQFQELDNTQSKYHLSLKNQSECDKSPCSKSQSTIEESQSLVNMRSNLISKEILSSLMDEFAQEAFHYQSSNLQQKIKDSIKLNFNKNFKILNDISPEFIEIYLNHIIEQINKSQLSSIIDSLNKPLDHDVYEKMQLYNQAAFESQILSFECQKTTILSQKFIISTFQSFDYPDTSQNLLIYTNAIIMAFVEALEYFRPYDVRGQPMPWQINDKKLSFSEINLENIHFVLEQSKFKVLQISMNYCGILPEHANLGQNQFALHNLEQIRQEKLQCLTNNELNENEYQWQNYEDYLNVIQIEISELIFNQLINEVLSDIEQIQETK